MTAGAPSTELRRCLGPAAILGQSLATVGLTLMAVLNIPDVQQAAGRATWLAYVIALVVLHQGGAAADLQAIDISGETAAQVRAGLMVAVLSFMGFESAANLGQEALRPDQAVPRALRTAVLVAGGLFLFWAVVLTEGLGWLPTAERTALDPISLLADQLGQTGSGRWIQFGTFLCLFGSSLGSLTAFGRLGLGLARQGVLPRRLAAVHPRFQTPVPAMVGLGLPIICFGAVLVKRGLPPEKLYNLFGGVTVLCFLLVYGLVGLSSLRKPLAGCRTWRRMLVGSSSLAAVLAVAAICGR